MTSIFHALEKTGLFIARTRKGEVLEYGPLWDGENQATLKRTVAVLIGFLDFVKSAAPGWEKGSGEGGGLTMNDGITVCLNVLRSAFHHLQIVKRVSLSELDALELVEALEPYGRAVGQYFATRGPEQMMQFRSLRGIQGQTTGTRRVEEFIQNRLKSSAFEKLSAAA